MDLFYKSIPQILIEARVVQVSYDDTLDIGVQPVNATTPTVRTLNDGNFVKLDPVELPQLLGLARRADPERGPADAGRDPR
ncbi:MAG: hypothetical protein R3F30_01660 [Planctomycetota bacterium]